MPLTVAEITPPVVPDADNAAILIKQAIDLIPARTYPEHKNAARSRKQVRDNVPAQTNSVSSPLQSLVAIINTNKYNTDIAVWTDAQQEEGAKLIQSEEMKELFGLLEKAAACPGYNSNLDWTQGPETLLPNYAQYRQIFRILVIKAAFEGRNGNVNEAVETILFGLKLNNKLKDEPILIVQLVRMACDMILVEELERLSNAECLSKDSTRAIIDELSLHLDRNAWKKTIDAERISFGMWTYDRLINGSMDEFLSEINPADMLDRHNLSTSMKLMAVVCRPVFKKDYVFFLKRMHEVQRRFGQPYYQIADDLNQKPIAEQLPRNPFISRIPPAGFNYVYYAFASSLLLPCFDNICKRVARDEATAEVCRVGLGLKLCKQKSGAYPETLDALSPEFMASVPVDPCTGKSLVYHKVGDGFLLYSLGTDQKDDNGKPFDPLVTGAGDKDFDIVWKCAR